MSKFNDYVYIVKLPKRYWLFRNTKELKNFLNGDNVFYDNIIALYRGFRPYYERRGYNYFYDE